jgi:hypothetical protein
VRYFVLGSAAWKSADTWPPHGLEEKVYYLSSDGTASQVGGAGTLTRAPREQEPGDTFVYDPHDPVPTLWSRDLFAGPSDRRKLEHRQDILYYRTPPLEEDVELIGHPEVILYASSSAPDTDFFAWLVDEYPTGGSAADEALGGAALTVSYGMVRARHRNSLDDEELLRPGEILEFRIVLGATACRFLKGHRIRLEITSSDYPNHDRNHNTGGNDLAETELVPARQNVFHSRCYPSRLVLGVSP